MSIRMIFPLVVAALLGLFACEKRNSSPSDTSTTSAAPASKAGLDVLQLRVSDDGTAIVDAQGNEIARFSAGIKVTMAASTKASTGGALGIPGCMCCKTECIAWDSNEKCVKTYRSCTWDFDCACK